MNISNPIIAGVEYVIDGPSRQYYYGFISAMVFMTVGVTVGVTGLDCYFGSKMHYEQDQKLTNESPFIRGLKDRIINHTQDLSDENPIKSLAQKYIWQMRIQQVKDRVYSWIPSIPSIPFLRR